MSDEREQSVGAGDDRDLAVFLGAVRSATESEDVPAPDFADLVRRMEAQAEAPLEDIDPQLAALVVDTREAVQADARERWLRGIPPVPAAATSIHPTTDHASRQNRGVLALAAIALVGIGTAMAATMFAPGTAREQLSELTAIQAARDSNEAESGGHVHSPLENEGQALAPADRTEPTPREVADADADSDGDGESIGDDADENIDERVDETPSRAIEDRPKVHAARRSGARVAGDRHRSPTVEDERSERSIDDRLAELAEQAESAWKAGKLTEAEAAYETIITLAPKSRQAELAWGDLFNLARQRGDAAQEAKRWSAYLKARPRGRHADDARAGLCRRGATPSATETCWRDYLADFPAGAHRREAERVGG